MILKEKRINGKTYLDKNWIKVEVDNVIIDKINTVYERVIIRHIGAICLLPLTYDNKVILVKQFRYPLGKFTLELPAGKINNKEDIKKAAKRECCEEIGFLPNKITKIMEFIPAPGYCDEKLTLFKCEELIKSDRYKPDIDEFIDIYKFDKKEIKKMIQNNLIKDCKTIIGLTHWLFYE